jgi:hypothetical protein
MAEDEAHFKETLLKLPGHQLVPLPIIAQMMDIGLNECTKYLKQLFGASWKENSGPLGKITLFFHLSSKYDISHNVLSRFIFFQSLTLLFHLYSSYLYIQGVEVFKINGRQAHHITPPALVENKNLTT